VTGEASFVPDDFVVPRELVTAAFRLEPLGPEHNEDDYRAWMSSIDHIRSTPGMQGHASDFAARKGFTYTVLASGSGEIVGCVYVYPRKDEPGARVLSWVRADRADLGVPVYEAVSEWLRTAWPFTEIAYAPR
jgi:hypothetical protein